MKESQQKLLQQIQEELLQQKESIEKISGKRNTRWKSLLIMGAVLIIVTSIAAYAYHQVLESISSQIPR